MKHISFILFFLFSTLFAFAQPANDNISGAIQLTEVFDFCSNDGEFTSVGATASGVNPPAAWPSAGNDVWYSFTALRKYVQVNVIGSASRSLPNTLSSPLVALYTYNSSNGSITELANGSIKSDGNNAEVYNGALEFGITYYIRVSDSGNNRGTFKLCLNNFTPLPRQGQDCVNSTLLCSKEGISTTNILGFGLIKESGGRELGDEASSAWYRFTAATTGTLTFIITPNDIDTDIDWILYKLNPGQNCANISYGNGIRFASGMGSVPGCNDDYLNTGMNMTATDDHEDAGCSTDDNTPRDGFVSYVTANAGEVFYLMINNVTSGTGFKLTFGGTVEFVGPKAPITVIRNNPCVQGQTFTVSAQPNAEASTLNWTFGNTGDFSIISSTATSYTILYNTLGTKVIALEATSPSGCITVDTKIITVGLTPPPPTITSNKTQYCIGETITLSATDIPGATYTWTGPGNFKGSGQTLSIPVTNLQQGGDYTVFITDNGCESELVTIAIPPILKNPIAAFRTDPVLPAKLAFPVTVRFFNQSLDADTYLWDFGDGSTSTDTDPEHTYAAVGDYTVTLTAFKQDVCNSSVMHGKFVVRADNTIFIPNTFTPNGDGVNDELVVTLINIRNYHIRIYNRWGVPLFESVSIFDNWKGTFRQEAVPVGTYYYLITAIDSSGNDVKRSGSVTVVR